MLKEAYVGLVGWAWMAAAIAIPVTLVRAVFFDGSWWTFIGSILVCVILYRVSLFYQLEKERSGAAR